MKHGSHSYKNGSGFVSGKNAKTKDPSCPSSGYVYGHSTHGGKSPSTKVKLQK